MPEKKLVCLPMLTVIVEHGTIAIPIVQFEIKVIYRGSMGICGVACWCFFNAVMR